MTGSPARAAILGKVPWHNEFLRGSALSSEIWAFDEWLFRNAQLPPEESVWGPSYGFLLQLDSAPGPLDGIAGVISPSRDQAGRVYPLAIAGSVRLTPDLVAHPEVVPIAFEAYWHTAVEILSAARSGPPDGGDWPLDRLFETQLESGAAALELYVRWAESTSAAQLCALLGRPAAWLSSALRSLGEAMNRGERGRLRSIRVPLGQAAGGALCFWLDVVRRAAGWRGRIPSFFWSHDDRAGEALVFLGAPGETALEMLWRRGGSGDDICDLTALDCALSSAPDSPHADIAVLDGVTEDSLWPVLEGIVPFVRT
jgi:TagF N-terminal domain, Type VI secretion system-associated